MPESDHDGDHEPDERFTFFCEMSMQEFAFGVGAIGVNALCLGMMLNIPTLTLHNLMYKIAPKGLLQPDTTDQERIGVAKAIIDYWYQQTESWKPKTRFKCLYDVFVTLREYKIAQQLKQRFEANQPISLELFHTFDLGRLGQFVSVPATQLEFEDAEEEEVEDDD
ncbi:mucin-2 [Biomphalaria glabrata]|uniref:Uncharacterized protein LOC106056233 n=1 Tax=Biomphalaria glabrata TaxID=6526 RepID=A0A2C9L8D6_BIOGL|nr:uncharacterized protein LOC106056233 [Biomphalaria glabrata]XP_055863311.1 uncharacterized protein LOC106056233 [Biomphalaria glabrata]XP_055863312.1 uncharacterized protein LOC106056233 [Biomphalaria glabrata]KAI8737534.1 hypothetical protein BgiMline_025592 [Biomphalaria glabrata]KAI8795276.1 hypothetical protein BgiBS90_003043 [Biomphalaria glabrata]